MVEDQSAQPEDLETVPYSEGSSDDSDATLADGEEPAPAIGLTIGDMIPNIEAEIVKLTGNLYTEVTRIVGFFVINGSLIKRYLPEPYSGVKLARHRDALMNSLFERFERRCDYTTILFLWCAFSEPTTDVNKPYKKMLARFNNNSSVELRENQLVLIKEDNVHPTVWPKGRIIKLHPGKDDVIRVVTLRTGSEKYIVRPTARLALLPDSNTLDN